MNGLLVNIIRVKGKLVLMTVLPLLNYVMIQETGVHGMREVVKLMVQSVSIVLLINM